MKISLRTKQNETPDVVSEASLLLHGLVVAHLAMLKLGT